MNRVPGENVEFPGHPGQHPNPFALAKDASAFKTGLAFAKGAIKESEGVLVLKRRITVPDNPENGVGVCSDGQALARDLSAVLGEARLEFNLPVKPSLADGGSSIKGIGQDLPEAMPGGVCGEGDGSPAVGVDVYVMHCVLFIQASEFWPDCCPGLSPGAVCQARLSARRQGRPRGQSCQAQQGP